MEEYSAVPQGTVDPEVRAYVTSLVTALGGTGADEDGRYVLGDDALACLRDIKRWLRLYDEKLNRLDVARVLAERDLIKGDLLEIVAAWPDDATEDRVKAKVALACFELLVPLTWPMDKNEEQATSNHYRNFPYLQLAQIGYKREILEHPSASILRAAVRVALPSLALPGDERTARDDGIIKLILYFLRNIALITAPDMLPVEWNETEVSASATINALQQQDAFSFLLTIASNIEEFGSQDVILLETLFHLVKGVPVEKLFLSETQLEAKLSSELRSLMKKEATMLRGYAKTAPTRHTRFGTMIWVQRNEGRVFNVSGQDVLSNSQKAFEKIDESKRVNRPVRRTKEEMTASNFNKATHLTNGATQQLRSFVEDFLDSGFNPLFHHLRRALEREDERVLLVHWQQYFYLIGWFLEAERMRRKHKSKAHGDRAAPNEDTNNYTLVASVLNQETFVLINRFMEKSLEHKVWLDVHSVMRGFIQILLTIQDMTDSPLEEDQEIADNIQNRIFYEESTHDMVLSVVKGYKDQGFSYLDTCTELFHVFLRLLERYSKENFDLQVRSRRRARKKASKDAPEKSQGAPNDSETEEVAEAQKVTRERKFDFDRFATKFVTQNCINTFTAFLAYYKDLDKDQLKRAHRFFYRVAFKQDMSVMLFRLDIIHLLHQITNGPKSLDRNNPMFLEWQEFAKQIFRRLVKKMQERPVLGIEILFSKISSTAYYLEYGHEKQTMANPRAPAQLEVKGNLSLHEQIGVVVATLHEEHLDAVVFVEDALRSAANERQSWEAESEARRLEPSENTEVTVAAPPSIVVSPDKEERRVQMFKNARLRLLMTLVGMVRLGVEDEPNSAWIVPSELSSQKLTETADVVKQHRMDPQFMSGSSPAEQMIRRKSEPRAERFQLDDDFDGIDPEEEFLFPAGGPTVRKPDALDELKKRRRKRRRSDAGIEELDEETLKARQKARQLADLERRRKIKSTEFVEDSDDDADTEKDSAFFANEELLRQNQAKKVGEALFANSLEFLKTTKRKRSVDGSESGSEKRSKHTGGSSDDELVNDDGSISGDSEPESESELPPSSKRSQNLKSTDEEDSDTPPSSQPLGLGEKVPSVPTEVVEKNASSFDSDAEAEMPIRPSGRPRGRIIIDDDDDD